MIALRPLKVSVRRPKQDPAFVFQNVFTRKTRELAEKTATMLKEEVQRQVDTKINATGALRDSITSKVEEARTGFLASASSELISAHVSEKGASPHGMFGGGDGESGGHSQFIANIIIWMNAKGIDGGKASAFRIGRAIARKGVPSSSRFPLRYPFTNARRVVRRKVNRMWAVELDSAIARLNRNA